MGEESLRQAGNPGKLIAFLAVPHFVLIRAGQGATRSAGSLLGALFPCALAGAGC